MRPLLIVLPVLLIGAVRAETAAELDQVLLKRFQRLQESPPLKARALERGRRRAVLCKYCHGVDGNGGPDDTPILASQNPLYLLHQLQRFASGERKRYVMEKLAAGMDEEDKVNLSLYYASVAQQPAAYDRKLAQAGKVLFASHCAACHGEDGRGRDGYARIAGQKPVYVEKTLLAFRRDAEKRFSPEMQAVSKSLSAEEIRKLAHYVAYLGHDEQTEDTLPANGAAP